jgi:hypothetical protein
VATAGCQLIGGIDARSLGEEPDAGPDGTASDAPAGGPDGMGPSDSAAAPDGLDAGTTDTGLADAGATDAGCGADAGLTYSQEVRCDAPLAYWRLDEPMGTTAKDSSGYGNDATYMGGFTLGVPGVLPGDSAVKLDGNTGYVNAGNRFEFAGVVPFTIEAWIQPNVLDTAFRGILSNEPASDAGKEGYVIYLQADAGIGYDRYQVGASTPLRALNQVEATMTAWYHVVGVYEGGAGTSSMSLYVNGSVVASGATTLAIQVASCPFAIGATRCAIMGAATFLQGSIDEVAVYGSALPASRILRHYQVGSGQ